jgi:hypothetical protein
MTYEELVKANAEINTTPIKGKEYAQVNQRIKAFRMLHPDGCIATEILELKDGVCYMKATVFDKNGNTLGTGHAYEKEESSYINKTSYIENCETSAVGRALGMLGIGVDTSIASAEEMENALLQQDLAKPANKAKIATLQEACKKHNINEEQWLGRYKATWDTLTEGAAVQMLQALVKKYGDA